MHPDAVAELMEEYFIHRRENGQNSALFRRKLQVLGHNEETIHEILLELDSDWQKEMVFDSEIKHAPFMIVLGLLLLVAAVTLGILGVLGFLFGGPFIFLWTGGVLGGATLMYKGIFARKNQKKRADRRRIKYKMYK